MQGLFFENLFSFKFQIAIFIFPSPPCILSVFTCGARNFTISKSFFANFYCLFQQSLVNCFLAFARAIFLILSFEF